MYVCGILSSRPDFYPPAYEERLDAEKQACPAEPEALCVPPPPYSETGLIYEDEDDAHPEAPPSYNESVADSVVEAIPSQRQSQECWSRRTSTSLRIYSRGMQLLIINAGRDGGRKSHISDPTWEPTEGMLCVTTMQFHTGAWPARAECGLEGCGQHQGTFARIWTNPNPGQLLDCKSVVRALLHRETFYSPLDSSPITSVPSRGGKMLLMGTPHTFMCCIT